jgi:hypothetical protein
MACRLPRERCRSRQEYTIKNTYAEINIAAKTQLFVGEQNFELPLVSPTRAAVALCTSAHHPSTIIDRLPNIKNGAYGSSISRREERTVASHKIKGSGA